MIKMKYVMTSEDKGIASFICCRKEEPGKHQYSIFYLDSAISLSSKYPKEAPRDATRD